MSTLELVSFQYSLRQHLTLPIPCFVTSFARTTILKVLRPLELVCGIISVCTWGNLDSGGARPHNWERLLASSDVTNPKSRLCWGQVSITLWGASEGTSRSSEILRDAYGWKWMACDVGGTRFEVSHSIFQRQGQGEGLGSVGMVRGPKHLEIAAAVSSLSSRIL